MAGPGKGRRSFLVDALSGVAGLWVTATGVAVAGCVPVTKYGGPPPLELEPVAKYGGPPEPGPDRFAQPPDASDAGVVALPTNPPDPPDPPDPMPPPVAKYGGPPPPVMVTKYGGPPNRLPSPPKYGGPPRF